MDLAPIPPSLGVVLASAPGVVQCPGACLVFQGSKPILVRLVVRLRARIAVAVVVPRIVPGIELRLAVLPDRRRCEHHGRTIARRRGAYYDQYPDLGLCGRDREQERHDEENEQTHSHHNHLPSEG